MTHQMKQFIIDGTKVVLNRPNPEARVEEHEFEVGECYAIDMVVSNGEGKSRVQDEKQTTVYKRDMAVDYTLKSKAARTIFSEINRRFPTTPFCIRALTSAKPGEIRLGTISRHEGRWNRTKGSGRNSRGHEGGEEDREKWSRGESTENAENAENAENTENTENTETTFRRFVSTIPRAGLAEMLTHGLIHQYPVLHEKKEALVAQVKGTVLLMPNGTDRIVKSLLPKVGLQSRFMIM